jgi:3-hydroxybutyryl-CoA dehydrogenase
MQNVTKILSRNVEKGKMSAEEKDAMLGRIKTTVTLKDMAPVDYVVEPPPKMSH